jgi:hypothetical protein
MVEVARRKYPLNPTLKLVNGEGRATSEFFRILTAIGNLIENITIQDGEVTADMISVDSLEAISAVLGNVIIEGDLIVEGTITTGKVAPNAISELTALLQGGTVGPNGDTILSGAVPVTSTDNTGLLLTFTSFMDLPTPNASNFGYWTITLNRNGVAIDTTPPLYYDDNFSYQPVASFIDPAPGTNPTYSLTTTLVSGLGFFTITGGVLNVGLLKR